MKNMLLACGVGSLHQLSSLSLGYRCLGLFPHKCYMLTVIQFRRQHWSKKWT